MQLKVPKKTVADTDSFPVAPAAVSRWLSQLRLPDSLSDVKELYNGLKHSNRLHNDLGQRRQVISNFIPALRTVNEHLSAITHARALPLTAEFARAARLQDSLLREEALSFTILLRDAETPSAEDARRAMQALARQAEAIVHGSRPIPETVVKDAHQLYSVAEEHHFLSSHEDSQLASLEDHYRFILLLSVAGLTQQRLTQLPAIIEMLRQGSATLEIERSCPKQKPATMAYAVNLEHGSLPEPATAILIDNADAIRYFSVAPFLELIDKTAETLECGDNSVAIDTTLERQSLIRLRNSLTRSRGRRLSRCISAQSKTVFIGHKEICAHFLYQFDDDPDASQTTSWSELNQSAHGVCLHHADCRAGLVRVGELISVMEMESGSLNPGPTDTRGNKFDVNIGVIRWVIDRPNHGIRIGVEFLTRTVLPVHVTLNSLPLSSTSGPASAAHKSSVRETALIMACKVQDTTIQTILLPPNVYDVGDKLCAWQGKRSLNLQLNQCLQANGLFSQYTVSEPKPHN